MKSGSNLSEFEGLNSCRSLFIGSQFQTTKYCLEKNYKHYQNVNPKLVIEWQGATKSQHIAGEGTFNVYEQSNFGLKNGKKLIFSLEAECWKNNKPEGYVKMTHFLFYTPSQSDSVVREVRRYTGKYIDMKKEGNGQYIIQYHYSNQDKEIFEIKGTWVNDYLVNSTISRNSSQESSISFVKNIEVSPNQKQISNIRNPILNPIKTINGENKIQSSFKILKSKKNFDESQQIENNSENNIEKNEHFLNIPENKKKQRKHILKK